MISEKVKKFGKALAFALIITFITDPMQRILTNLRSGLLGAIENTFFYYCAQSHDMIFINLIAFSVFYTGILFSIYLIIPILKKAQKKSLNKSIEPVEKRAKRNMLISKILAWFLGITILPFFFFVFGYAYLPTLYKSQFDLELITIKPYIERVELEKLESDWTQMETKEDYILIQNKIEKVLLQNNLKKADIILF